MVYYKNDLFFIQKWKKYLFGLLFSFRSISKKWRYIYEVTGRYLKRFCGSVRLFVCHHPKDPKLRYVDAAIAKIWMIYDLPNSDISRTNAQRIIKLKLFSQDSSKKAHEKLNIKRLKITWKYQKILWKNRLAEFKLRKY